MARAPLPGMTNTQAPMTKQMTNAQTPMTNPVAAPLDYEPAKPRRWSAWRMLALVAGFVSAIVSVFFLIRLVRLAL
jgi:hypothetical protein